MTKVSVLREWVEDCDEELPFAEGFDEAILGIAEGWFPTPDGEISRTHVVAYDWQGCVEILVTRGMTRGQAEEWMGYNASGAYLGEGTPVFVRRPRSTGE
jgi:hypothetical protein